MRVTLAVTEGPHRGHSFTFDGHDTFLVGRSPEAHFALPSDLYFSRNHFLVEINPPLCRLIDLGSRNGTFVNGRKVQTVDLRDGDEVRGGQTVLRVCLAPAADGAAEQTRDLPAKAAETLSLPARAPATDAYETVPPTATAAPRGLPAVPGYRLLRELGRGGMGVVYQAECEADGSRVALKTILPAVPPTATAVRRFLREADVLGGLAHPYLVGFRGSGEAAGLLYFAMDFVDGPDAGRLLREGGPLVVGRAVRLVCQALEGLAYAHSRGFVHRDVKPANLLVARAAGREEVRLADFGLARAYQSSPLSGLTVTGATGGTPTFMPPEQVLDFRGARPPADQYSAAATLYNLLTGATPHDPAPIADLLRLILQSDPVPLRRRRPDLPAELEAVVHRALARRPEERFADADAFRRALLPFVGH